MPTAVLVATRDHACRVKAGDLLSAAEAEFTDNDLVRKIVCVFLYEEDSHPVRIPVNALKIASHEEK